MYGSMVGTGLVVAVGDSWAAVGWLAVDCGVSVAGNGDATDGSAVGGATVGGGAVGVKVGSGVGVAVSLDSVTATDGVS